VHLKAHGKHRFVIKILFGPFIRIGMSNHNEMVD
jgi:hypothetical protein